MDMPLDPLKKQAERRNSIASVFIVILMGVAFQEMVSAVRDSVHASGLTLETIILFSIFFMAGLRFFTGNLLYIVSDSFLGTKGKIWFFDFMVIVFQTVIGIFIGTVSSVQESRDSVFGFFEFLIALYILDVLWIISQWLLGKVFPSWKRAFIPKAWGVLNAVLVVSMLAVRYYFKDFYSVTALLVLGGLNLVGFIVDIWLVDYHKII